MSQCLLLLNLSALLFYNKLFPVTHEYHLRLQDFIYLFRLSSRITLVVGCLRSAVAWLAAVMVWPVEWTTVIVVTVSHCRSVFLVNWARKCISFDDLFSGLIAISNRRVKSVKYCGLTLSMYSWLFVFEYMFLLRCLQLIPFCVASFSNVLIINTIQNLFLLMLRINPSHEFNFFYQNLMDLISWIFNIYFDPQFRFL